MTPPIHDLSDLSIDEVSVVKRGAIGRRWSLLKADSNGDLELERGVVDALSAPLENEAVLVEKLQKAGLDEAATEAAVAVARLTKSYAAEFALLKGTVGQHTPSELLAISDGSWTAPDDEDDDAADKDNEFETQADISKRDYSTADRRALAAKGHALPNLSYPIGTRDDLENAITLAQSGHGDVAAAKALIVRRAKELGATDALPASWSVAKSVPDLADRLAARIAKGIGPA
jgi:hypothetical protein